MEQETLNKWRSHASPGQLVDFPYHRSLLAIAMGQYFDPCPVLSSLLAEFRNIAERDTSVEVPDSSWLHMTFLALSPHLYAHSGDYPNELPVLIDVYDRYAPSLSWTVREMRLVPTANSLLLAGIPDRESIRLRQAMADEILNSPWKSLMRKRYAGYPVPPVIWHTTLMRSRREFLPEPARAVYFENKENRFADIHLGQPLLAAVTYDWSLVEIIRKIQ